MTIREWMDNNINNIKSKIQQEEVEILEQRVYNNPVLDEESEPEYPTPKQYKRK